MPHNDDTDRFCPVCHGARRLLDTSTTDYGYTAKAFTPCWSCYVPDTPSAHASPDDLMDAALAAKGMTRAEWSAASFDEYRGL